MADQRALRGVAADRDLDAVEWGYAFRFEAAA
jgi:hypothetical protein